ncbi:helix-turn-helix domain-containing protein [Sneathiella chungangensis]|uniref:Helix-turn-helix domain-containing protein n=1 Tax=Sneathiella chungangensis TaxID=1418234 RepID=A0A845MFI8_9PROT|nr:metalloregulator ArsR/SmtB family transcription factor [Sneathiella chungangensis]MZR22748.1 helix-turn-helix domain-containing protein [Sneathiella chungangensis]
MNDYITFEAESTADILKALANINRLQILIWILDPRKYFPPQRDGDLVDDGVCVGFITERVGLSQPTVTNHMNILADAGLVTQKKIKNWVFYKPDREKIDEFKERLGLALDTTGVS